MMFRSLLLAAGLFSLNSFAETICAPSIPKNIDPHQVLFPLENDIASRLYLPLLPAKESGESVAKSWGSTDGVTWKIVLNDKLKFQPLKTWRATKPISADDVVFSIQRQLKKNARSVYDELTFLPARRANLDYKLKEIKVLSPNTLTMTFWQSITEEEFTHIFKSPVGYVVSADFGKAAGKAMVDFFPSSGAYTLLENKNGPLTLATRTKEGKMVNVSYKELPHDANVATVKGMECDQVFYPRSQLLQELKSTKSRFFPEKLSNTKLFLIVNPDVTLSQEASKNLRSVLAASKYQELKALPQTSALFGTKKPGSSSKSFTLPPQKMDLYYCDAPTLSGVDMEKLAGQVSAEAEKSLNLLLIPNRTSCELLPSKINNPMVGVTLSIVNYQTEEDIANQFICSYIRSSTGFCMPNVKYSLSLAEKKKIIQPEFDKSTYVVPLIDSEDFVVQF